MSVALSVEDPSVMQESVLYFFVYWSAHDRDLHSFPTRRSSDLPRPKARVPSVLPCPMRSAPSVFFARVDRKSTRLNSSHVRISYAVFCFKKKIKISPFCLHHNIRTNADHHQPDRFRQHITTNSC